MLPSARAHELRPARLEITETAPGRYEVLWHTPVTSGMRLPVLLRFPANCRYVVDPSETMLSDSILERSVLDAGPGGLGGKRIEFVGLRATVTDVLVTAKLVDGSGWTVIVQPVRPWLEWTGTKTGWEIAQTYLMHGIRHILFGVDHLLFVLGLLLLVNDRWMLLKTITAFTVAHSLTLGIATLGYASAPLPPLNVAIALSILFLGPEIVRRQRGETSLTIRHPWVVAFAFGLLHGFGFASGLTAMGLAPGEIPVALLMFNVGVEIGQLFFVLLIVLLERSFRTLEIRWPRWAAALPSYTVGSLGAFWTLQRAAILWGGFK